VSGAHNTIVTARAGKDVVSSLVSGKHCLLLSCGYVIMMLNALITFDGCLVYQSHTDLMFLNQVCLLLDLDLVGPSMMLLGTSRMHMRG